MPTRRLISCSKVAWSYQDDIFYPKRKLIPEWRDIPVVVITAKELTKEDRVFRLLNQPPLHWIS